MLNPITLKNFKAMYESENDYLNHEIAMHNPDEDDEELEEDSEMEDLIDPDNEN